MHIYLIFLFCLTQILQKKPEGVCGIWTWSVGVEGEHADGLTTTTAHTAGSLERLDQFRKSDLYLFFSSILKLAVNDSIQNKNKNRWQNGVHISCARK